MKNQKSIIAILLITILAVLSACQAETVTDESEETDDVPVIGMSFDSFLIERWERDRDVFVARVKEAGAEVNVQNANGDIDTQIEQIRYFIERQVDAIVVIAIDADAVSDVLSDAKAAGIPVVAYDRLPHNANVDIYVSIDNNKVGELMAEALVNCKVGEGKGHKPQNVLMLSGPLEDNNVSMVNSGFTKICEENEIEIADTFYTDGWTPELASDYLRKHPELLNEVEAIMCGNDNIATQVVRVLSERRKAGDIPVTGQDAELEACQHIVQGTQLVTIYKPVEKEAVAAADAVIEIIEGKTPTAINAKEYDGSYYIPSIILEPVAVTKDNIDEVIVDSGFHRADDVYLYAPK